MTNVEAKCASCGAALEGRAKSAGLPCPSCKARGRGFANSWSIPLGGPAIIGPEGEEVVGYATIFDDNIVQAQMSVSPAGLRVTAFQRRPTGKAAEEEHHIQRLVGVLRATGEVVADAPSERPDRWLTVQGNRQAVEVTHLYTDLAARLGRDGHFEADITQADFVSALAAAVRKKEDLYEASAVPGWREWWLLLILPFPAPPPFVQMALKAAGAIPSQFSAVWLSPRMGEPTRLSTAKT